MWVPPAIGFETRPGRGLRIAELLDACAGVSKQQHAVDRYIVNDRGSINDCSDAMRSPDAVSRRSVSGLAGSGWAECGSDANF
jgi:hypothetical protein